MLILVNIVVILILFFSFIGGLKDGVVKSFFSLLALIIAIPIAGAFYRPLASALSFMPGENWENFVGFFIILAAASALLTLGFLLPRKLIQKVWNKGGPFRLIGGAFNVINAAIGMTVFTLLVRAYPIFGWLEEVVTGSGILTWLVVHLSFVQAMLPEVFQDTVTTIVCWPALGNLIS